jgi:hypothetical protein
LQNEPVITFARLGIIVLPEIVVLAVEAYHSLPRGLVEAIGRDTDGGFRHGGGSPSKPQ